MQSLNTFENRLTLGICGFCCARYALSYFLPPENSLEVIATIFAILGISIEALIRRSGKAQTQPPIKDLNAMQRVNRHSQLAKLSEAVSRADSVLIVSGDSGCGKSWLVHDYCSKLHRDGHGNAHHIFKDYNLELRFNELHSCSLIVLDQFERALKYDNIATQIHAIKRLAECGTKIVIVVRSEYVGPCAQLLGGNVQLHFLENDKDDALKVIQCFQTAFSKTTADVLANPVLGRLVTDFESNRLRFVQLDILVKYMKSQGIDALSQYLNDDGLDYRIVSSDYLNLLLRGHCFSRTAAIALYLLSVRDAEQGCSPRDVQVAALESSEATEGALRWLNSVRLVEYNGDDCDSIRSQYAEYKLPHDYYRELLRDVCRELVDPRIRENIDYYALRSGHDENGLGKEYARRA